MSSPSSCLGGCGESFNVIVNNQNKDIENGSCVPCVQVKEERSTEEEQHGSSISEQAAVGQLGSESSDDEDKDESCSATEALEMDGDGDDQSSTAGSPQAQNIPKNVKLPQSKLVTRIPRVWHHDCGLWATPKLD